MKREVKLTTAKNEGEHRAYEHMMSDKPNSNAIRKKGKWVNRK